MATLGIMDNVWFEGYYIFLNYFLWCKGGLDFSCEILRDVEKSCYDGFNSKGGYFFFFFKWDAKKKSYDFIYIYTHTYNSLQCK